MDPKDEEIARLKRELEGRGQPPAPARKLGCGGAFALAIVFVLVMYAVSNCGGNGPEAPRNVEPLSTDYPCNMTETLRAVNAATSTGLVREAEIADGGLVLVVRGNDLRRMTSAEREVLAAAYDCQIAGDGSHLAKITFRTTPAGPDYAVYEATDLLRLRARG